MTAKTSHFTGHENSLIKSFNLKRSNLTNGITAAPCRELVHELFLALRSFSFVENPITANCTYVCTHPNCVSKQFDEICKRCRGTSPFSASRKSGQRFTVIGCLVAGVRQSAGHDFEGVWKGDSHNNYYACNNFIFIYSFYFNQSISHRAIREQRL